MPQSLSQIFGHLVFSTKYRQSFITEEVEDQLFKIIGETINCSGSQSIIVGGYMDHVHILYKLSRIQTIAKTVEMVKTTSSKWMKKQGPFYKNFYWQDGYAIFPVMPKRVPFIKRYIQNQKQHHQSQNYKSECIHFFKKHIMEYDERYVWD